MTLELRYERLIAASPERVFEALTDPAQLAEWWGSDDTLRTRQPSTL